MDDGGLICGDFIGFASRDCFERFGDETKGDFWVRNVSPRTLVMKHAVASPPITPKVTPLAAGARHSISASAVSEPYAIAHSSPG